MNSNSSALVSIIIPCYNHGEFIINTLESLSKCDEKLHELIIINDGSTDEYTLKVFVELEQKGYRIIHQQNGGLSAARNTGILVAKGKYILPLDADNKIRPEFLIEGIQAMENDNEVVVVYGDAEYFGEKIGIWKVGEYNLQRLMLANYIDACAMIRKSVFDQVGLYDTNLKLGLEDWEFWLRLSFRGCKFVYVPKILFDYRVIKTSMSKELLKNYKKRNKTEEQIEQKFQNKLSKPVVTNFIIKRFKNGPIKFIIKLILASYFPNKYEKLLKDNKIVRGL